MLEVFGAECGEAGAKREDGEADRFHARREFPLR